ncbi:MAG: hypothetical protein IKN49_04730 [Elusimicrobiaceae bacterium]|nr:hypothetical protein [Elusimicrobiaceae bacterium]
MNTVRKVLLGLFVVYITAALLLLVHEYQSSSDIGIVIILLLVLIGPGVLLYAWYYCVKFDQEKVVPYWKEQLYGHQYDDLKKQYGPIVKEISIVLYIDWGARAMTIMNQKLSICRDVMFLSDNEGSSVCIPYSKYRIYPEDSWLHGKRLVIEKMISVKKFLSRDFIIGSPDMNFKERDLILSLVQQAQKNR